MHPTYPQSDGESQNSNNSCNSGSILFKLGGQKLYERPKSKKICPPLTPRLRRNLILITRCISGSIIFKLGGQRLCKMPKSKKHITLTPERRIKITRAFLDRSTLNLVDRGYARCQVKTMSHLPLYVCFW
jgi:hypothetical protein